MDRLKRYTESCESLLIETDELILDWDALSEKVEQINSAREGVRNAIRNAFAATAF